VRQAAALLASQAEEIEREKNLRLAALDDAFQALKIAEECALAAEAALSNAVEQQAKK